MAPVSQALLGTTHAAPDRRRLALRSCRSPKAAAPITGCWSSSSSRFRLDRCLRHSSAGLATHCAARRPGIAAFPIRARRRNTAPAASPSRSAACLAPSCSAPASIGRHAAARRPAPGAADTSNCAIWSGTRLTRRSPRRSASPPTRLNVLQFLTIRRYLSLVFLALVILLLVLALWP